LHIYYIIIEVILFERVTMKTTSDYVMHGISI